MSTYYSLVLFDVITFKPFNSSHVPQMLRRIVLAKAWNYALMDSCIMLAKSSYYALACGDADSLHLYLWSPKMWKIVPFSRLPVAISTCTCTTQYMSIPIPRCPCMQEINMEKRKNSDTEPVINVKKRRNT